MITRGEGSSPKRKTTSTNRWSCIDKDILDSILGKLPFVDKLTSRAVCSHWRFIAKAHVKFCVLQLKKDPLLMIEQKVDERVHDNYGLELNRRALVEEERIKGRWFYSIKEKKIQELNVKSIELRKTRCVGSSNGWLIFTEDRGNSQTMFIYNPLLDLVARPVSLSTASLKQEYAKDFFFSVLAKCRIPLGVIGDDTLSILAKNNDPSDLPLIRNAILAGDPIFSEDNYSVVIIYGSSSKLAFAKSGDANWRSLDGSSDSYCDVVSREKCIYAVTNVGSVQAWDFSSSNPSKVFDIKPCLDERVVEDALGVECRDRQPRPFYLLESMGKFILVARYTAFVRVPPNNASVVSTKPFRFYELNFDEMKWVEVYSLGDRVVFLGENQTTVLPAGSLPGYDEGVYCAGDYFWTSNHEVARNGRNVDEPRFWVIPCLV